MKLSNSMMFMLVPLHIYIYEVPSKLTIILLQFLYANFGNFAY